MADEEILALARRVDFRRRVGLACVLLGLVALGARRASQFHAGAIRSNFRAAGAGGGVLASAGR